MPPISGLMPYPWPAVSAVHTKDCAAVVFFPKRVPGAVVKWATADSPRRPSSSSNA